MSHMICHLSEDVLFGHFVIALNAAFTHQLSLADEGYESGSDTVDLPTSLRKTPCIHHVSSMEHASFNPVHTTPCSTVTLTPHSSPQTPTRPVCCCLSFSSDSDQDPDSTPVYSSDEEEEDFQMVPLDDKTGHQSKYLRELFAYTKMDYHTTYANIHALMEAVTLFHTWIA